MNRLALPLAAALILSIIGAPPAAGASKATSWTAWLATNGAASLSLPSSGTGTIAVRLAGLARALGIQKTGAKFLGRRQLPRLEQGDQIIKFFQ